MNGKYSVAVGGVGGSGTRIVAQFLVELGYYIGSDLNEQSDNLWFTLLFKRRNILVEPRLEFDKLARAFLGKMSGVSVTPDTARRVAFLAAQPRLQYSEEWLRARAESFYTTEIHARVNPKCGWKEPNTHVVVERLLELDPMLRYVHVVRNGLDMAFSKNQNQLELWGPIFLDREVAIGPRDSLAYWCEVHRRLRVLADRFPGRIMFLSFEEFCINPKKSMAQIIAFADIEDGAQELDTFASKVIVPVTTGIFRKMGTTVFNEEDLKFVEDWGYPVE